MKTKLTLPLICLGILHSFCGLPAFAQGTAFTYQGRLNDGASPASGIYDLRFTIYDLAGGGSALAGPLTNSAISVSNGLFTLTLDFGNQFPGADRWLEIGVVTNGGGTFTTLAPRQPLTAAPYAIMAGNVSGAVAASQLSGAVPLANLPTTALVTNGQTGVNLTGNFSGNGAGVTNLNLSLNSGGAISGSGSFRFSSSPSVGNTPRSVTAADVNGDGKVDLISADSGPDTLTVLTNNGSGVFTLSSSPGTGNQPFSVIGADVNGDGRVDLISANLAGSSLTVLTNNGSGGFALSSSPGVGTQPQSVAAADVNGEGKGDLISANYDPDTLTVLTNNGGGGFALSSSPGVGNGPVSVTAADVNGDGRVDLISANFAGNSLTVLTNNGSGGFALSSSPSVGTQPQSVAAADVNGDGKVDLISANATSSTLTVLTNNGGGGFALSSSPGVGNGPVSVTAADVNGDGRVDLISANESADALSVLINNGSGGFALSSSPGVGDGPYSVTAADVNGDGKVDLISVNVFPKTLTVLLNVLQFTGNFAGSFPGGNVGIGTISPQVPLHIASDPQAVMVLQDTGTDPTQSGYVGFWNRQSETAWVGFGTPGSPDFSIVNARPNGDIVLSAFTGAVGISRKPTANKFEVEGTASKTTAGSWQANSDARIKTDVRTVTGALDKLSQVRLVEFHYTEDYRAQHPSIKDRSYLNVVAQEFQKVFPEYVQSSGEKLPGGDEILQVDTYPLTIYSAAAIQELNRKLEQQHAENVALKQRLAALEKL
ncbi:MAG: VCBS repeat-containing protein, partial [Verrucomicrobia subdivision 3 bacterium]|nr:VCBS repeat-containing protein [Limisphaerales bacterium]